MCEQRGTILVIKYHMAKNYTFLACPLRDRKFAQFCRRFRLDLRIFNASVEGARLVFRVFCMETAYYVNDVIISNSREQLPQVAPAPLRTPMVVDLLHS